MKIYNVVVTPERSYKIKGDGIGYCSDNGIIEIYANKDGVCGSYTVAEINMNSIIGIFEDSGEE